MNKNFKKIISFSLWGDNPKYTIGAIRNAELTPMGWISRFYCGLSVPTEIVEKYPTYEFLGKPFVLKNGNKYIL